MLLYLSWKYILFFKRGAKFHSNLESLETRQDICSVDTRLPSFNGKVRLRDTACHKKYTDKKQSWKIGI